MNRFKNAVFLVVVAGSVWGAGCGPSEIPPGEASSIPVINPSPDNPTKDVTLENESEHIDKIGGISKGPGN
ncbi:MAG: hypothetical protein AB7I30_10165 [Isosphaeraceae bacterium]